MPLIEPSSTAIERTFHDFKAFMEAIKAAERLELFYEAHKSWGEGRDLMGIMHIVPAWTLTIESEDFPAETEQE